MVSGKGRSDTADPAFFTPCIPMNAPSDAAACRITLQKHGSAKYSKQSFPLHCGVFHELVAEGFVFHFNLNGEIIRAQRKGRAWRHPHEWLKRTRGNDWVYYSTGGYTGVFEAIGEYYLPNFAYPSNNLLGGQPFAEEEIRSLTEIWHDAVLQAIGKISHPSERLRVFLAEVSANTPAVLEEKAERLRTVVGGRISVLPPDARHVEYNLIPLTIANGCLHKCRFCKVKNSSAFRPRTKEEILEQIARLKELWGADITNCNAVFLGEHDALQAGPELLLFSIEEAYRRFGFADSWILPHRTFLFGSAASLLNTSDGFFADLERLPGLHYLNIGLESADQETLDRIGKPITAAMVKEAFARMQEINDRFNHIEITANFIMDENLPENHYPTILQLIRESLVFTKPKGSIYFSPLTFNQPSRARLFEFNRLKVLSRLPTFLYIIQRL